MKILIVEDHAAMRRMLRSMVVQILGSSHEIIESETGEDGLGKYKRAKPDCVLMDFELPKMNGLEASKLIFKEDPEAKVIFVTSYTSPSFQQKLEVLPALGIVFKCELANLAPLLLSLSAN